MRTYTYVNRKLRSKKKQVFQSSANISESQLPQTTREVTVGGNDSSIEFVSATFETRTPFTETVEIDKLIEHIVQEIEFESGLLNTIEYEED